MGVEPCRPRCEAERVVSQDAYVLRENTGTSGALRTVHAAFEALSDYLIQTWDALQAEA